MNLRPQLPMPCHFIPSADFDFSACKEYMELKKKSNPKISIYNQELILQTRLNECSYFNNRLIKETFNHANAYLALLYRTYV